MKCPECGGDGVITFSKMDKNGYFNDAFFMKECSVCHGTGEVQTNEEWLRQCNTEQLIEFLEKITDPHVGYLDGYWQEWLKQPHQKE